jgi:flagellar hook protein FlgE
MSLYGVMTTSVSGMAAQSSKLSTVADNISNSGTTGYKKASAEFSSMVLNAGGQNYTSGGVSAQIRYGVSEQGSLTYTNSLTDLAVSGDGFLVVADASGTPFLTRAGSFVPDSSGDLVNASGHYLMGFSYENGAPDVTANSLTSLTVVNVAQTELEASPSTAGSFAANLTADAAIVAAADLPSANAATAAYTAKASLVVYDNLGGEQRLDVYFTKTATSTWEVAVFDQAGAAAGTGFPYAGGALATQTLSFDPTNGHLAAASATTISLTVPGGASLTLDLGDMTQLESDYVVLEAEVNGNAPSAIERIEIDQEGILYAVFENGSREALYQIPLADVPSPNNMLPLPGNVFSPTAESGDVRVGFSGESGFGNLLSGALESSTVDLATELTMMIEAQRSYTANSKVFQTASDLLDVLVNLRR